MYHKRAINCFFGQECWVARSPLGRCAACVPITRKQVGDPVAGRLSPPVYERVGCLGKARFFCADNVGEHAVPWGIHAGLFGFNRDAAIDDVDLRPATCLKILQH